MRGIKIISGILLARTIHETPHSLSMAVGTDINRTTFREGAAAVFANNNSESGFELVGILNTGWVNLQP